VASRRANSVTHGSSSTHPIRSTVVNAGVCRLSRRPRVSTRARIGSANWLVSATESVPTRSTGMRTVPAPGISATESRWRRAAKLLITAISYGA
jgi:hypothetical protein